MQADRKPGIRVLRPVLIGAAILTIAWAVLAGMAGYQLGTAPTGLNAAADCELTMRVDFIVPMWKTADPAVCGAASSGAPTPAPATVTQPGPAPAPAPAPPTPAPAVCRPGFGRTAWGGCVDQRHQPCPAGYTGWQNTAVDNCLQEPIGPAPSSPPTSP